MWWSLGILDVYRMIFAGLILRNCHHFPSKKNSGPSFCGTCVDFPEPVSPRTQTTRFSKRALQRVSYQLEWRKMVNWWSTAEFKPWPFYPRSSGFTCNQPFPRGPFFTIPKKAALNRRIASWFSCWVAYQIGQPGWLLIIGSWLLHNCNPPRKN